MPGKILTGVVKCRAVAIGYDTEGDTMTALAMILAAGMAVPGIGPEKVSGEMAEPQRLDLSGSWEGVRKAFNGRVRPIEVISFEAWGAVDEGDGRMRFEDDQFRIAYGIYRQHGDRLMICFAFNGNPRRPTRFQADEGQEVYILHRVKPRK